MCCEPPAFVFSVFFVSRFVTTCDDCLAFSSNWLVVVLDGPLSMLKKKLEDKSLLPDEHQMKVAEDLQKLYEQLQGYEPAASSTGLSKWFSFSKKEVAPGLTGLYIYGSVGGGKTMLVSQRPPSGS